LMFERLIFNSEKVSCDIYCLASSSLSSFRRFLSSLDACRMSVSFGILI
jgi:hypothetical protein